MARTFRNIGGGRRCSTCLTASARMANSMCIQVLSFIAGVFRRSAKDVEQTIAAAGLREVLGKRVNSLSKGFSRRLLLALGFLAPQPVLLMDEPFDGFDLRQAREMMPVLRDMASSGRTLLLSIHQMTDAERVCDRFVSARRRHRPWCRHSRRTSITDCAADRTFGGDLPCAHVRYRREDRYGRCSPRKCARSRAAAPFGSCFSCSADWSDSVSCRRRSFTARRVPRPRTLPCWPARCRRCDGILVPTLGGFYLGVTLLFPFVAIRVHQQRKGNRCAASSVQLPYSVSALCAAKLAAVLLAWAAAGVPALSALAVWMIVGRPHPWRTKRSISCSDTCFMGC